MSRLKTTGTAQDHRALLTVCRTRISHPPLFHTFISVCIYLNGMRPNMKCKTQHHRVLLKVSLLPVSHAFISIWCIWKGCTQIWSQNTWPLRASLSSWLLHELHTWKHRIPLPCMNESQSPFTNTSISKHIATARFSSVSHILFSIAHPYLIHLSQWDAPKDGTKEE